MCLGSRWGCELSCIDDQPCPPRLAAGRVYRLWRGPVGLSSPDVELSLCQFQAPFICDVMKYTKGRWYNFICIVIILKSKRNQAFYNFSESLKYSFFRILFSWIYFSYSFLFYFTLPSNKKKLKRCRKERN